MKFQASFQKKTHLAFISFLICFILASVLTGCGKEPPKSRMEKRISLYLNNMETSAVNLEHAMDSIADAKVTNTVERMRTTVKIVEEAEKALDTADIDVGAYIAFINKNKSVLKSEGLEPYIVIKEILDYQLRAKRRAMTAYFSHMKRWLNYSADHYSKLKAGDPRVRQSYDAMLIKVNRSLKQYNMANDQYHRHTRDFVNRYPALKKKFKRQYKTMKKEMGWL